eukprot:TRINITY_DN5938_c0_g1_i1.p1 TRINITY_DN5938_c0_g1~~TRINITY_DN5938_c0_g1_i1.p1  ORF type:complete len:102 (+),score=25.57 TRINITY_DN5938_c0_g1_i1:31-306(+)
MSSTTKPTLVRCDGTVYLGDVVDGKMDGKGVLYFACGSVYEGEYKNNKIDGRGVFRLNSGNIYEGEFRDNQKNGRLELNDSEHKQDATTTM